MLISKLLGFISIANIVANSSRIPPSTLIQTRMAHKSKGVKYDDNGNVIDCLFCKIHKREEPGTILYEDNEFVVFKTKDPMTEKHVLVTPRTHIKNIDALQGPKDAEMVQRMVSVGNKALGDLSSGSFHCFHVPPLNSIDHLHLHCIAKPETMSFFGSLKYNSYFARTAECAIRMLNSQADRQS